MVLIYKLLVSKALYSVEGHSPVHAVKHGQLVRSSQGEGQSILLRIRHPQYNSNYGDPSSIPIPPSGCKILNPPLMDHMLTTHM